MKEPDRGGSARQRALYIVLVIAVLGAIGGLCYFALTPQPEERFTEYYILGLDGRASNYPSELRVGEEGRVVVCIVNHEHQVVNYRVEIRINGVKDKELGPILLHHEDKWQQEVGFTLAESGNNQKVEFLLYKNEEAEPHSEPLYILINVTE